MIEEAAWFPLRALLMALRDGWIISDGQDHACGRQHQPGYVLMYRRG